MKKDIRRGEKEFDMMADLWRLYKNFYVPENTDEYWTRFRALKNCLPCVR